MKKITKFVFAVVLILASVNLMAQNTVKGVLLDASNGETLIGASVIVKGTTQGTISNLDGSFSLNIPSGKQTLVISYIGYIAKNFDVSGTADLGEIKLSPDAVGLKEVSVVANMAIDRQTPVAVSRINPTLIEEKLGTQEYPEILKSTPSVYTTRQGGGYGDGRINLRGFDSRNVAVMINGIPVNDMESGKVYWSNWAGLADVTRSMQVQRGLGASKVAVPSVGGTINILTRTTDMKRGGNVLVGIGDSGYSKYGFTLSTGLTESNWAVTASFAKASGNGWVDGTQFEAWSYFLNVSKRLNDNHTISFSIFGAPQEHGQRSSRMTIDQFNANERGTRYNPDWGYKSGQVAYVRRNFYHKPQAILNHFWSLSENTDITNSFYASFGTGGGSGPYGNTGKFDTYLLQGQVDFDRIVAENVASNTGSETILRASRNDHVWYGYLGVVRHNFSENLKLSAGLDLRSYVGKHFREVTDLLGGDYYVDANQDVNDPNKVVRVGDKIDYANDGHVAWMGGFAQMEYTKDALSTFLSGSVSNMGMKRVDYFQYAPENNTTEVVNFMGFGVKGGANYNLTEIHNVFANVGYFERQPDFRSAFLNYKNDLNTAAVNEKITSFELGYGLRTSGLTVNLNGYYTKWGDKTFIKTQSYTGADGVKTFATANILGVDALHMGVELDLRYAPTEKITVTAMASVGNWRWLNDIVDVPIYDDQQNKIKEVDIYLKDVHVGDAAQTTAAFGFNYEMLPGLKLGVDYNYYTSLFANFDPLRRNTAPAEGTVDDSWEMPAYGLLDLNIRYKFEMAGFNASLNGKINNLLDTEYFAESTDGGAHDWQSAVGYYGVGRTWSMMLKVKF